MREFDGWEAAGKLSDSLSATWSSSAGQRRTERSPTVREARQFLAFGQVWHGMSFFPSLEAVAGSWAF